MGPPGPLTFPQADHFFPHPHPLHRCHGAPLTEPGRPESRCGDRRAAHMTKAGTPGERPRGPVQGPWKRKNLLFRGASVDSRRQGWPLRPRLDVLADVVAALPAASGRFALCQTPSPTLWPGSRSESGVHTDSGESSAMQPNNQSPDARGRPGRPPCPPGPAAMLWRPMIRARDLRGRPESAAARLTFPSARASTCST